MWKKFSLKIQLIVFMTFLVVVIEGATLIVIHQFQKIESRDNATLQVETLTRSLNNDLIKVILNSNADSLADITLRLTGFKTLNGLVLFNASNTEIFEYKNTNMIQNFKNKIMKAKSIFNDDNLLVKSDLVIDGFYAGFAMVDIDLSDYKSKQEKVTQSFLILLPISLLFSILISIYLSRSFTKPFRQLLYAMQNSNPTNGNIIKLDTDSKNEIRNLFLGFNKTMQDISDSSNKLKFQATHDQLTGLYNRFFIENEIKKSLSDESIECNCLLVFNLDQFKLVNDTAGMHIGDNLLITLSRKLQDTLDDNILIARSNGDDFTILLKNYSEKESIKLVEEKLSFLKDFRIVSDDGQTLSVSSSFGLISYKANEYTFTELIKATSTALKLAKANGRNRLECYDCDNEISQRFDREIKVANFINEALTKKENGSRFELFAQDIVPLQYETNKIGYEILIRMWDSDGNFVSPDDFLPTAQRYQKMVDVDMWVLWEYLTMATKSASHIENLHSAHINLAGSSLNNPDFQAKVREAVATFNFPWSKLDLEVTESSAVGSFSEAREFISWLKNVGIKLALDDFGTGMASFEYLKSLPFDVVKIDGSFVKDMHDDEADKSVIKYIHEVATIKGQETVAEYVETQKDVDTLRDMGITYGQGYFLGKPRPLSTWIE